MPRKLTHEKFCQRVANIFGNEYIFYDKYINSKTKLRCEHKVCGRIWNALPASFLNGHGCTCRSRKTNDQFLTELKEKRGNEYSPLEKYIDAVTKIEFRHNECGYVWKVVPNSILRGFGCPKCNGGLLEKQESNYLQKVRLLYGDSYQLESKYNGLTSRITVKHTECGRTFQINAASLISENKTGKCPYCRKSASKLTHDEFQKRVVEKYEDDFEVLDEYVEMHTPIRFKHTKCGIIFLKEPSDFLEGHTCRKCNNKTALHKARVKRANDFCEKVKRRCGQRVVLLTPYIGAERKILALDTECGTMYWVLARTILKSPNLGCPTCRLRTDPKLNDEFLNEVSTLVGNEYTFLEKYVNAQTSISCRHNICGHVWKIQPNNFLTGYGCPHCATSWGERFIGKYLKECGISHYEQYKFSNCKDQRVLPFDFYLPSYNLLIEYDGEQHYKPITHFGGEEKFAIRHKHDLIKNKYCEDNNINLLRIPYTVKGDDIGKTIQTKLSELNNGAPEQLSLNLDEVA